MSHEKQPPLTEGKKNGFSSRELPAKNKKNEQQKRRKREEKPSPERILHRHDPNTNTTIISQSSSRSTTPPSLTSFIFPHISFRYTVCILIDCLEEGLHEKYIHKKKNIYKKGKVYTWKNFRKKGIHTNDGIIHDIYKNNLHLDHVGNLANWKRIEKVLLSWHEDHDDGATSSPNH